MTDVSDADLQKIREDNDKLRQKIADAETKRAEGERKQSVLIEYTQLQAENTRLEAQLAQVTEAAKVGNVREGSAGLVAQAEAQLAAAVAQGEATVGPVDTNAPDQPKNTTGMVDGTKASTTDSDGGNN